MEETSGDQLDPGKQLADQNLIDETAENLVDYSSSDSGSESDGSSKSQERQFAISNFDHGGLKLKISSKLVRKPSEDSPTDVSSSNKSSKITFKHPAEVDKDGRENRDEKSASRIVNVDFQQKVSFIILSLQQS